MRSFLLGAVALGTALAIAAPAAAVSISFKPGDRSVAESPAFGAVAEVVGSAFKDFGVDFTFGGREGIFSDPPLAFAGVNARGIVDLLTNVDGEIVLPGTLLPGLTSYIYAEAGNSDVGTLTLSVFDSAGNLLASALNGPPPGAAGRTTFEITRASADIAFFSISGGDSYGVNEIRLETPVARGEVEVPAPAALALFGFAVLGFASLARRR